jgi:hypothetical protein
LHAPEIVQLIEYYNGSGNVLNIVIYENRHIEDIIQVQTDLTCRKTPSLLTLHWRIFAEMESHIDKATEAGIQSICRKGGLIGSHLISVSTHSRTVRKEKTLRLKP